MADFLKEPVIQALHDAGRPLKSKELAKALKISGNDYQSFREFLRTLQAAGELYRVKHGRYAPPDRINLIVGHLTSIRSGAAFLIPEKPGEDDVYVPADELANAYHGDKVVVRLESRRGRPEGRVVRILERARTEFVGTVRRGEHFVTVRPDDPKFRRDVFVPLSEGGEVEDGQKVTVEITDWGSDTSGPIGRVAEVLGMPGEPGLDVLLIIKHNSLDTTFPAEVDAAADKIPDEIPAAEIRKRLDLRKTPVITIDPVTAKDFDDALSLTERDDGDLELGVHIADVSHYVRFDDVLDREAYRRATSVYLVDRVLPMLPEKISNNLCSLNPDVDRLAMSVIMHITPRGKVVSYRIEDTVIRSCRRLAYEQVQGYFDGDLEARKAVEGVESLLDRLRAMAKVLNGKRVRRGALDFDLPASRVELDEEGLPVDIRKIVRQESHRLVEEFMLLANETVARHFREKKVQALFRVHEEPREEKLEDLQTIIGRFGYSLFAKGGGQVPPKELQRVLAAAAGKPEEQIVNMMVLRSLARARYDTSPIGHFGLALKDYTHFTSPIRRYPDLLVHRTLRVLSKKQEKPIQQRARYQEWLEDAAIHTSERERLAESAERDSVELKKIQFMERHVGDEFTGVITGVESFGFFVELERYFVSGLVHINALEDDYYEYWEEDFSLVGSNSGRRFTLGDKISVRVLSVNKELRQIDFVLVDMVETEEQTEGRRLRKAKSDFEGRSKRAKPTSRLEERKIRRKGTTRGTGRSRAAKGAARARQGETAGGTAPGRKKATSGSSARPAGKKTASGSSARPAGKKKAAKKTSGSRTRRRRK